MFSTLTEIKKTALKNINPCSITFNNATEHQSQLIKPLGSLGKLEEIAIWLASWQREKFPKLNYVNTIIFAGNHGVAKYNISLFPKKVTKQMVKNFKNGKAAINQLCKLNKANLKIIELELDNPTQDFTLLPAMNKNDFIQAINIGAKSIPNNSDLILLGEMGIANTTSSSAIAMALFGGNAINWTGKGTGLNEHNIKKKIKIVNKAVIFHKNFKNDPIEILRRLGGREHAAIFGAILSAREKHIPVLLDGFTCCSAIAPLYLLNKDALSIALIGHLSTEVGHIKLLKLINKQPLLEMNMCLGEGSGAALALGIIRAAVETHNKMSTFYKTNINNIYNT